MEELMTTFNMDQLSGMLVGGILAVGAIGSVVSFVMSILSIIGGWKMFRKFWEPGWKAIIPFYGTWVEYQYTWKPIMMIPVVLLGVGGGILMNMAEEGTALQMIASAVFLVGWVLNIIAYYKRCKAFGHGIGFTIGHIVAPGLFTIILGFGKSQYIGNTTTGAEAPAGKSENE